MGQFVTFLSFTIPRVTQIKTVIRLFVGADKADQPARKVAQAVKSSNISF